MTESEQQVIHHVVEQLTALFPVERVILFGSRARGEAREDSDYDFLVVVNLVKRRAQVAADVRKAVRIPCIPMDFLIRTPEEWEAGFLLKKEIVSEGKVVYETTDTGMD